MKNNVNIIKDMNDKGKCRDQVKVEKKGKGVSFFYEYAENYFDKKHCKTKKSKAVEHVIGAFHRTDNAEIVSE